jgi:hypothetical protein
MIYTPNQLIRAIILLSLILVILTSQNTNGQSNDALQPIVNSGSSVQLPDYLYWSNDSQTLVFADAITLPIEEWYSYSVNTGTLTMSERWPLTPSFTEDNCPEITPYYRANGQEVPPFISPDGHFLTYTAEQVNAASVRIAIADCQLERSFTLPDLVTIMDRVLWSGNSGAFVTVDVFIPDVYVNYVTNYAEDVSNAILRKLSGWSHGERNYTVKNAFDISSDGNRVLLLAASTLDDLRIYIYNAQSPSDDILVENFPANQVIAGAFAPNDETKLWLLAENGVVQYDLQTGLTTLLDTSITSTNVQEVLSDTPALFSPDGRYLAVLQDNGLYLLELSEFIPPIDSVTPVATAQSDELQRLLLVADCPSSPTSTITTWDVLNPNSVPVTVQWQQFASEEEPHAIEVPGGTPEIPGEATFETEVEFYEGTSGTSTIVSIYVDDIFHDQRECFVPRES